MFVTTRPSLTTATASCPAGSADDLARFHGTNERIAIADYARVVSFYEYFIRQTTEPSTRTQSRLVRDKREFPPDVHIALFCLVSLLCRLWRDVSSLADHPALSALWGLLDVVHDEQAWRLALRRPGEDCCSSVN